VIEFKVASLSRKESLPSALESAMAQIKSRGYADALKSEGITHVRLIALAFSNKQVLAQLQ